MSSDSEIESRRFYDNENDTGLDRIKKFYKDFWNGIPRAEHNLVVDSTLGAFFTGAIFRSFFGSNTILHDFHRKHNTSVFLGKTDLKKQLTIFTVEKLIDRGFRFGAKCATLTFLMSTLCAHSFIYRKDFKLLDFSASMGVSFGLTRYNMGIRSILSAFTMGFVGGIVTGTTVQALMALQGTTLKDYLDQWNKELSEPEVLRVKVVYDDEDKKEDKEVKEK